MKIPNEIEARWAFYAEVTRKCKASMGNRRRFYQSMRNYYMYGCDGSSQFPCKFNKLYPHIDTLTSFLYSQETTRFATTLGSGVSDLELKKLTPVNRHINDEWCTSNTDIQFGNALTWALVYSSTFIKPRWKVNGIEPFVVDPHNFGVLREDSPQLSSQEAFVHEYWMTRTQLSDELQVHPRRTTILESITASPKQNVSSITPIDRIITSASSPVVIGNVDFNLSLTTRYAPQVSDELVQMTELYVYDSDIEDYRVVTLASPYVLVYDRALKEMFLKHEAPFVQICPLPAYDYFWGFSEIERLVPLQEILNQRWNDIMHMLSLQARPPKAFSGYESMTDEIAAAFDSPDGQVSTQMPGSKVENMAPQIPADLWKDVEFIYQMFEETSGINNVMTGKGEAGVRSSGHAAQLARLGSSRVKKRAMIIEDSLEKLTTLYLQILRKYDKTELREEDGGDRFILDQLTEDFVVKVDGHSNSPIFVEDQTQIAFELLKAGAITKERLLELISVPMRQLLLNDLKVKIEPAEQAAHQEQHDLKVQEIRSKERRHA